MVVLNSSHFHHLPWRATLQTLTLVKLCRCHKEKATQPSELWSKQLSYDRDWRSTLISSRSQQMSPTPSAHSICCSELDQEACPRSKSSDPWTTLEVLPHPDHCTARETQQRIQSRIKREELSRVIELARKGTSAGTSLHSIALEQVLEHQFFQPSTTYSFSSSKLCSVPCFSYYFSINCVKNAVVPPPLKTCSFDFSHNVKILEYHSWIIFTAWNRNV